MFKSIKLKDKNNNLVFPYPYYPIGSLYLSINNENPSNFFGGTWQKIEDKFLLMSGTKYKTGNTGGEENHILTTSEMPSHSHNVNYNTVSGIATGSVLGTDRTSSYNENSSAGGHWHVYTTNSGGNKAHNNMPPYLVVNGWIRIE